MNGIARVNRDKIVPNQCLNVSLIRKCFNSRPFTSAVRRSIACCVVVVGVGDEAAFGFDFEEPTAGIFEKLQFIENGNGFGVPLRVTIERCLH